MQDKRQSPNLTGAIVAIVALALGYGFVRNLANPENLRPFSAQASVENSQRAAGGRVESRLWQDPFESFGLSTNSTPGASPIARLIGGLLGPTQAPAGPATNDLLGPEACTGTNVAILGVMLEGGPYAEDKEVRLRLRYAVETALLNANMGPEDRTHIFTNAVDLAGDFDSDPRSSWFAYEWFQDDNAPGRRCCALWLNESDFADKPALRLGSLLNQFPWPADTNQNTSFYLIGPRNSDTLKALLQTRTNNPSACLARLQSVARSGHFHILSPEATATLNEITAANVTNQGVAGAVEGLLRTNIFHPWIATDQQLARLISAEIANRIGRPNANNVVVVLSEQDTYYGRKLADEWTAALTSQPQPVCVDSKHVWQFAYLRGLDGSKPQAPDRPPALGAPPETALETALQEQRQGQRAGGDAQLDYATRLAEFLKQKSRELAKQNSGAIVAFGLAGSDTYDKLLLLQQIRRRFPDALCFTTSLDASLWTYQNLPCTRNLLVASAYPLDPFTNLVTQPDYQQFAPFRDVYQTAVYKACLAVALDQKNQPDLAAGANDLLGG
ncbi:MAG TPA: hypothetical protein VL970_06465, partial [Candidatus Acidoferrales bacterium]|nr:hypothetical protein [Candidatus Acidoferrales bacterium]